MDVLDRELWIGILVLTTLLYVVKWFVGRKRNIKVYRVSPKSLKRSKDVMMTVLPLVEDGENYPLDRSRLLHSKENIKSAAKILAYYFFIKKQVGELDRIKHAFVAISRFQDPNADLETQERRLVREGKQLERELQHYMTHSPFNVKKTKKRR